MTEYKPVLLQFSVDELVNRIRLKANSDMSSCDYPTAMRDESAFCGSNVYGGPGGTGGGGTRPDCNWWNTPSIPYGCHTWFQTV